MKHALVTGGAGFIGSELIRLLQLKNYKVTVFDNLSFGKRKNNPKGIRFILGDVRSKKDLQKISTKSFDLVFHLAAVHFIPYCNEHPEETIDVNVVGTFSLLNELKKPKKIFFASTAAIYGKSNRPHREDESPNPLDIYGASKLICEEMIQNFSKRFGVSCVVGRLFNAFGPRETNPHLIPSIAQQINKGKKVIELGNLLPKRDYIHTTDMARAIFDLTTKSKGKWVLANIGTGKEYSVREVVQAFQTKKEFKIKTTKHLRRKNERMHLCANIQRLRKITHFSPRIDLQEGICELLQ